MPSDRLSSPRDSRPLPIDALLGPLKQALQSHQCVVVEAAPGAGKTTRIPSALLAALTDSKDEIWVAEPRRVAARLAARFVAGERGCQLGHEVGYTVRFEDKTSPKTQLRFVTEGILLQRLSRPKTRPPAVIVLDEFHERHLDTDLNLMLARQALKANPKLRLVVMSATLDAQPIADYLGGCPLLTSEGRAFPLTIEHAARLDDRPIAAQVASAVKKHLQTHDTGNVLAFLPGVGEIRKAQASLEPALQSLGIEVFPLYGDMPLDAQARAIAAGGKRKVVLATNVAESSVTVEGVTAVVDSGQARVAEHSPWTGRQTLQLREISQASAIQRAGRAGRTAPGHVIRLYTQANFRARPAHDAPEVQRLDLAASVLLLRECQLDAQASSWLSTPPEAALAGASTLLHRLRLLKDNELTALGRQARRLPLPPRLARLVLEGQRWELQDDACLVAALLGERELPLGNTFSADADWQGFECDVDRAMDRFRQAQDERFRAAALRRLGLHAGRVETVRKVHQQLLRQVSNQSSQHFSKQVGQNTSQSTTAEPSTHAQALGLCLLAAFPDRVARRRKPAGSELTLCSSHAARLSADTAVRNAEFLLAISTDPRGQVTLASPLQPEWLLDFCEDAIDCVDELVWDSEREKAWSISSLKYGALVLEESRLNATAGPQVAALVARAALAQRANLFGKKPTLELLLARAALLAEQFPDLGFAADPQGGIEALIHEAATDACSLQQLRDLDWHTLYISRLSPAQSKALRQYAPETLQLAAGRKVTVQYESGKPPWIASRLQDFFGMNEGPQLCAGRVALTLHLLAPNRRAVQITSDLSGFWERHYPAIRKELRRRYPRHAWPEDPLAPKQ